MENKKFGEYILSSGFRLKYFVQKVRNYKSLSLCATVHGADDTKTLCNIQMNEEYFISGFIGGTDEGLKVTCKQCLKKAKNG